MHGPNGISEMRCGFCGLPGGEDRPLLGGLGVMICGDCAREAARSFDEGTETATTARQRPQLESFQRDLVTYMRSRGTSWGAIGDGLGVARQSAWERFRHLEGQ